QLTISQLQTDTAILLVGENRGTAECFTQGLAITEYQFVATLGQHALVVREFAIDQFRGEGEFPSRCTNMVLTEDDADDAVWFGQQTCQLKNTLARHDDLVTIRLT